MNKKEHFTKILSHKFLITISFTAIMPKTIAISINAMIGTNLYGIKYFFWAIVNKKMTTNNCASTVAIAEPSFPQNGIKITFNMIVRAAPIKTAFA